MMETTYKVGGMTCQGCANSVSRALEALDPVERALVDFKAGTVVVQGPVAEAAVKDAVEAAGFDYHGVA